MWLKVFAECFNNIIYVLAYLTIRKYQHKLMYCRMHVIEISLC